VLAGLAAAPRTLPCKLFYDEEGSKLYERITELEVYYPFRAEIEILRSHGADITAAVGPGALVVEYGSGSSAKTRLLLDALQRPSAYVPIDISREHLLASAETLSRRYPGLPVIPLCADFTATVALPVEADPSAPRLAFFPGSTIGNFEPAQAVRLLARIRDLVGDGGRLLIGVDLPKDRATLELAYDDPEGVTAAFNRNILMHVNRRFGADFDPRRFAHEARWNAVASRVEMHLRCLEDHAVTVGGERFELVRGETLWTESSHKHAPERFRELAAQAGFGGGSVWLDGQRRYSLHLLDASR
jgi:dimethylhistidine N-methyltransferase